MDIARKDGGADIHVTDPLVPRHAGRAGDNTQGGPGYKPEDHGRAHDPDPIRSRTARLVIE